MKKSTTTNTSANTNEVSANTNEVVIVKAKAQPKFSAIEQAKAEFEKKQALENAIKTIKVETTKKEIPMKTTTTTTTKAPEVKAENVTPEVVKEKKKSTRAVQVTEEDAKHFGLEIGDVCTLKEATNGTTITAQITSHYYNKDNNRSATHLIVLDTEGKPTTKKINVYTIRLTKVAPIVAPKVAKKVVVKTA
jgi:hypothetical protein